ncbi:MAG: hypothetical protein V4722_10235 [Bacteroidota bacterium]
MDTTSISSQVIDMEAIGKLTIAQRFDIIEAIQNTMGSEYEEWLQGPDEDDEDDEGKDDLTLAREALAEYKANPSSATPWEDFYKEEVERLKARQVC